MKCLVQNFMLFLLTIQSIAEPANLQETENDLDINSICNLSKDRYPDKYHTVEDILHTYSDCLQNVNKYSDVEKDTLMKQLLDRLECFKVDLKEQYYAGNVKYEDVEQVSEMEVELRGKDHSVSCNAGRHSRETVQHVIPLVVTGTLTEKKKACEAIFKQQKRENLTEKDIPTPQLDNNLEPKELTVPLAKPSTYRLDSPQAVGALTQYYKVVMKCLTLTTEHKIQVFRFNKRFYDWLEKAVLPHLKDDKCYPAFGGVLRIVETMKQNEFVPRNSTANFIFYRQKDLGKEEEERRKSQDNIQKVVRSSYFLLIALPLVLLIILILLYLCWIGGYCYSLFCGGKDYETDSTSSTEEIFYYPIEDSHSVSIILDDVHSEANFSSRSSNGETKRQRGGADYLYNFTEKKMILSLPLKRLLSSRNSTNGYEELPSPGKRLKKT